MRLRLARKKARGHSSKYYIQMRPKVSGVRAGKGIDSQLCHCRELRTREGAGSSLPGGSWEGVKSIPRRTTYHGTAGFIEPPVQGLYSLWSREGKGSFITDHPTWSPRQNTLDTKFIKPVIYMNSETPTVLPPITPT